MYNHVMPIKWLDDANDADTRIDYYYQHGFTKEAEYDPDCRVRMKAYRARGFNLRATRDSSYSIRLEAYLALGFTEDALADENETIRFYAKRYFEMVDNIAETIVSNNYLIPKGVVV